MFEYWQLHITPTYLYQPTYLPTSIYLYLPNHTPTYPPLSTYLHHQELLEGLRGGRGTLSMSSSIPLRKGATCALTGLVKAWLWTSGGGSNNGSSSSGSGGTVLHPPTQLSEALWSFLRDQALPAVLGTLAGIPPSYTTLSHPLTPPLPPPPLHCIHP